MIKKHSENPSLPLFILLFVVATLFVLAMIALGKEPRPVQISTNSSLEASGKMIPFNFASQVIKIDDTVIHFSNGKFINGSQTVSINQRTLNSVRSKAAAIITDQSEGSGTFYYVIGAKNSDNGEVYSKPVLLGDRVKIESLEISDEGVITVTYLDRALNAPMSAEPTKKIVSSFAFQDDGNLIPLLHN